MKHTALLLIALCATSTLAARQPEITGASGFKFGDVFDTSKAIEEAKLADGSTGYKINPIIPYRGCSVYIVKITPKTHLIHSVVGNGWFNNVHVAQKELKLAMELLQRKYGENKFILKGKSPPYLRDAFTIEGSRRVEFSIIEEESGAVFIIHYIDLRLYEQAEKEQLEIDLPKTDPSGL